MKIIISMLIMACLAQHAISQYINQEVYFDSDSYELSETSKSTLNDFSNAIVDKNKPVVLTGYTDLRHSEAYNIELSTRRSEAVGQYLQGLGFSNIHSDGFGETHPVCEEQTEACLARNRRVVCEYIDGEYTSESLIFAQKPFQKTWIIGAKSSVVRGKEGTVILFPAEGFKDKYGRVVTDSLEIYLREYYCLADMVKAGMTTMSDEGYLESAGSIEIRAFRKGEELSYDNAKQFGIAFPTRFESDGMETFYGSVVTNKDLQMEVMEGGDQNLVGGGQSILESKNVTSSVQWKQADKNRYEFMFKQDELYGSPFLQEDALNAMHQYIDSHPLVISVASMEDINRFNKNQLIYEDCSFRARP